MIETGRTIEQITIDALRSERKKVSKRRQRYSEQLINPHLALATLNAEVDDFVKNKPTQLEYLAYLEKINPRLNRIKKACDSYDKRDLEKVSNKEMVCRMELKAINEKLEAMSFYASRKADLNAN